MLIILGNVCKTNSKFKTENKKNSTRSKKNVKNDEKNT